jgi:hypothetical protein
MKEFIIIQDKVEVFKSENNRNYINT